MIAQFMFWKITIGVYANIVLSNQIINQTHEKESVMLLTIDTYMLGHQLWKKKATLV